MPATTPSRVDLAIVGAGVVGLAHAVEAIHRGLSVVVIERDERPIGASVRNFGHVCLTGQVGDAFQWALAARDRWLALSADAGFWARPPARWSRRAAMTRWR